MLIVTIYRKHSTAVCCSVCCSVLQYQREGGDELDVLKKLAACLVHIQETHSCLLRNFSKIGSLPRLLYIMTIELTFEKFARCTEKARCGVQCIYIQRSHYISYRDNRAHV